MQPMKRVKDAEAIWLDIQTGGVKFSLINKSEIARVLREGRPVKIRCHEFVPVILILAISFSPAAVLAAVDRSRQGRRRRG